MAYKTGADFYNNQNFPPPPGGQDQQPQQQQGGFPPPPGGFNQQQGNYPPPPGGLSNPGEAQWMQQQQKSNRRRNCMIFAVIGGVVCLCLAGIAFFVSDFVQEAEAITEASTDFFNPSLDGEPAEAAEHTCEEYRDSVANNSVDAQLYTSDLRSEFDESDGDVAYVLVTGEITVISVGSQPVELNERFRLIKENDEWVMCDEKLERGFWGYYQSLEN